MNDFYLAAIPEPVTLLGLRLRPFSLGHVILLHRVESSFVTEAKLDYNDLALSVFICSQTYCDALAAFNDKALPRFMRKWAQKLTKAGPLDLKAKADEFATYIRNGSKVPYYDFNPSDLGESHIEAVQSVKVSIMSKTTLTESELLDRPWGLCLHDYVTLQAMDNRVRIMDRESVTNALEVGRQLAEAIAVKQNGTPKPHS